MVNFYAILLYGSLWGIIESTLGYLLHLTPFHIGSLIWLPLSTYFMLRVYKVTGKKSSIIYISLLSSLIKMLNMFLPGSIDKVINPAISIMCEGIAFTIIVYIANLDCKKFISILTFNSLWRLLYTFYLLFSPNWIFEKSHLIALDSSIDFFLYANLKTCITTWIALFFENKIKFSMKNIKPYTVFLLLFINIICNLFL